MSTLDRNKSTARRWLDLVSAGDLTQLKAVTSPDWVMLGGPPNLPPGHAGLDELFRTIGPVQQTWEVEQILAEGDLVAVRAINHCTQESFLGVPGRGIEQIFAATFLLRIVDGRVIQTWRTADDLGRLLQLGAHIEAGAA